MRGWSLLGNISGRVWPSDLRFLLASNFCHNQRFKLSSAEMRPTFKLLVLRIVGNCDLRPPSCPVRPCPWVRSRQVLWIKGWGNVPVNRPLKSDLAVALHIQYVRLPSLYLRPRLCMSMMNVVLSKWILSKSSGSGKETTRTNKFIEQLLINVEFQA